MHVGCLRHGQSPIPEHFILTDKAWSERIAKLNRSLAMTHPTWPVHFYDDAAAVGLIRKYYGATPYVQVFESFKVNAHRADFFRYAALHAKGGYYIDADNCALVDLGRITRGFDFVTAVEGHMVHNGFLASRAGSGLMLRLLHDMVAKARRSSMRMYCYFVRSGFGVIRAAIPRRVAIQPHTPLSADGYNGSCRERVLLLSHQSRATCGGHRNHSATLWSCPRGAAPRQHCECVMQVGLKDARPS
jgi:hypothetical protein